MAKKHVDPLKAKQKKQKIVAGVLGVLFLGVMAFQVPRVMKQLHPAPPPSVHAAATTTTPTTGATPTLAAPTLAGGNATPATSAPSDGSSLASSSAAPAMQDGQLASFSLFASKDPFAQQITDEKSSTAPTSSSSRASSPTTGGSGSNAGGGKAPTPGSAVISVNGTLYSVAVGTDFPQASPTDPSIVPLFHLVSMTAQTAKISIVGGSYANGAPTVALTVNKPVTLMNTADGTRYKLILKPVGTAVQTAPAPTKTSPTTTVPVPPPSSP